MATPQPPLTTEQVEQLRRFFYQQGREAGMKLRAVVYSQCCEKHHARLFPGSEPGTFICMFCQIAAREQHPPADAQAAPNPLPQEWRTSGIHKVVTPLIPKRPMPPMERVTSLIRTQQIKAPKKE